MAKLAADSTLQKFFAQQRELEKRVLEGTLDPVAIRQPLQDIIIGKLPVVLQPDWLTQAEERLELVHELNRTTKLGFKASDFPSGVPDFMPATSSETLLLAVYLPDKGKVKGVQRTFEFHAEQAALAQTGRGRNASRWPDLKSDPKHLRLFAGNEHRPGIRWVGFDRQANWAPQEGRRVDNLSRIGCAGPEVLMEATQSPDWPLSWNGTEEPYPDMAGYQYRFDADDDSAEAWDGCPYLVWWQDSRELGLLVGDVDDLSRYYAAPRVREL